MSNPGELQRAASPVAAHRRYGDWTHTSSFTVDSLDFLLRNAGFDTVEVQRWAGGKRPPVRVWRPEARRALRRWVVVKAWEQVMRALLGSEVAPGGLPPAAPDFTCIATVSAASSV